MKKVCALDRSDTNLLPNSGPAGSPHFRRTGDSNRCKHFIRSTHQIFCVTVLSTVHDKILASSLTVLTSFCTVYSLVMFPESDANVFPSAATLAHEF